MFVVKWRNRNKPWCFAVVTGLSKYPSREAAERQVTIWKLHYPQNTYYIEPTPTQ